MIYSFSTEYKCEWFLADWYPQPRSVRDDAPAQPSLDFNLGDGCIKGFRIGEVLNELMAFDVKAFAKPQDFDIKNEDNRWVKKEIKRLKQNDQSANQFDSPGRQKKNSDDIDCFKSTEYLSFSNQFLDMLEGSFTIIKNCETAKKCFRNKIIPSDPALWSLKQLGLFEINEAREAGCTDLNASACSIDQITSFLSCFSELPATLQTKEFFRKLCKNQLNIELKNFNPPDYEQAIIAIFEASLEILELDTQLYGHESFHSRGIDVKTWIDERRLDLIQLCAAKTWNNEPNYMSYRAKNENLEQEFNEFVDAVQESGIESEKAKIYCSYIVQGIALCRNVNEVIQEAIESYNQPHSSRAFSNYAESKNSIPNDLYVDAAITGSIILNNTFSVSSIEELIACMAYAAIGQGYLFQKCPECSLPFIKTVGNNKRYCSEFCQQEHAKEVKKKEAPSSVCQNIRKKAKQKKEFGNYFMLLDRFANSYYKNYQRDKEICKNVYDDWVIALSNFRVNHLKLEGNKIKCIYGKDKKGREYRTDPLVPLILNNQVAAVFLEVKPGCNNDTVTELMKSIDEFVEGGKSWVVKDCQKLVVKRKGKKGRAKEELTELIALGEEKKQNRPIER